MIETFAVALVGEEPDRGWLVDAESAGAAVDRVHAQTRAGNAPAASCSCGPSGATASATSRSRAMREIAHD